MLLKVNFLLRIAIKFFFPGYLYFFKDFYYLIFLILFEFNSIEFNKAFNNCIFFFHEFYDYFLLCL